MAAPTAQTVPPSERALLIPQLVPGSRCLRCDVCCRFPDPDSPLRPYFTADEIARAVAGGVSPSRFPSPSGGQVALVPDEEGEGFHCPAFDLTSSRCLIYDERPLDCLLYPLALMWDESHDEVVLGWDRKCPFMEEQVPDTIRRYADQAMVRLNDPDLLNTVADHPRLIGRFQPDVVELSRLPALTRAFQARWGTVPSHRLTLDDVPRIAEALNASGLVGAHTLAAYSVPYVYLCTTLLSYWWVEFSGLFCLFAESPDGWFMPLPPLGDGPLEEPIAAAFELMRRRNGADSPVSRIDNVSPELAARLELLGYRLQAGEGDYLYRARELAALAGDRFKSQRALCNKVEKAGQVTVSPYELRDRVGCRRLLQRWQEQKQAGALDSFGRFLLEDAASTHEIAWSHFEDLGLSGTVVRMAGEIRAYTFGFWLTPLTWCVLMEVADREAPGLAQYLFRETCRTAMARGAEFINTMDDAGLSGLSRSKDSYHPVMRIRQYSLLEDRRS